jgi:hypothetical protein
MIVTAWTNGTSGYGLKLNPSDRDEFFKRTWRSVYVCLDGKPGEIEVNIAKASFLGGTCRELIHHEIGEWLEERGLVPWPKGNPPKLRLEPIGERRFMLKR